MSRYLQIIIFIISISHSPVFGEKSVLKLVYKGIGKPPYMQRAPDNSGLYYEMIKRAAEKIGFKLEVVRVPKKRSYKMLQRGEVDLYPSGIFHEERSEFLFFIPNGLRRVERYYGITARGVPEIFSISDINKNHLIWLVELGSTLPGQAQLFGVEHYAINDATMEKAIKLINRGNRPFFFRIIQEELDVYMDNQKVTSTEDLGIRVHKKCCESLFSGLYTGFSRFSPHYKEQPNTSYDKSRPLSPDNFPFELVPGSIPYRLKVAFKEMIDDGEILDLKIKYSILEK